MGAQVVELGDPAQKAMGVFSWFRATKSATDELMSALAEILGSERPDVIVETARQMICDLDPNGCVQTLVGYKNMKHIELPVSKRIRAKQVKAGVKDDLCPDTIETFARFLAKSPIPNEPTRLPSGPSVLCAPSSMTMSELGASPSLVLK